MSSFVSVRVCELFRETFEAAKGGTVCEVTSVSGSTLEDFSYTLSTSKTSVNATEQSGSTGFCNMTIPEKLVNGTLAVLTNGQTVTYQLWQNSTH